MAAPPSVKRLNRGDFAQAPGWVDSLLVVVNSFFDSVYAALSRGLTFGENFRATIREVRFTTLAGYTVGDFTPIVFATGLGGNKAQGVIILQLTGLPDLTSYITIATSLDWLEKEGDVVVRYISGLDNSTRYLVRLLVV